MSRLHSASLALPGALLLSVILLACTTVPDAGRMAFNFIPDTQLSQMGLTEFEKIKSQKRRSRNAGHIAAVNRVAERLKRIVPVPGARWEFVVFDDGTPNAFALPGGKVGVNSGIFQVARNDAQLAAVIGHELAHVVAGHSGERLSTGILGAVGVAALGAALGGEDSRARNVATGAAGAAVGLGMLRFSRGQELEADRLGTLYMARAGYDPRQSVQLWQNFARHGSRSGGGRLPAFLSTHPLDSTRIASLEAFMPRALSEYH
ncbi:MAG: M48 family metallopeptidase [Verrucomicrobiaceae bacterium]|nr:M48 family metallopeptidase [Verrucomicrobiaceae bacterium]